ncbi:MAG: AzlC family ABC transporter permease [Methylobacteriaceae bacterium]|nr:AzlC family ABC transporter permease [Methylobacteriaceae bacterium]
MNHTPLRRAAEFRDGARDILPPLIAAAPIGLVYGAICASKGMTALETALMSGLVFAGGSQFAAAELWAPSPPLFAIALSTLMINARHVLMGASLARKARFGAATPLAAFFMADENWALAERRAAARGLTLAYWFGMAAPFWLNWLGFTTLGSAAGALLGDPARLGADFAFTALIIGLVAGFWKGRATGVTVAVSGVTAALVWRFVGSPWHVLAGAAAGMAAAAALVRSAAR